MTRLVYIPILLVALGVVLSLLPEEKPPGCSLFTVFYITQDGGQVRVTSCK